VRGRKSKPLNLRDILFLRQIVVVSRRRLHPGIISLDATDTRPPRWSGLGCMPLRTHARIRQRQRDSLPPPWFNYKFGQDSGWTFFGARALRGNV
jgi:hypothetical protein